MFTLKITINERIASIQPGQSEYVTGSVGIDEVLFEFADNFWDDFIKKAVFQNSEGIIREGFLDSENKIAVPDDILLTEGYIKIGLYGVDANEKVITSTVVKINNKEGTPVEQGGESEYENIYAQVLAFLQEINSNYVPKTRKIANQPLSDDISSTTLYNILMALATNSGEANATLMNAIKVGSDDTMSTESDNVVKNRIVKAYIDNLISQANSNISNLQTNKENKNNKVTAISQDSTDVEYPSAKCVYDNVKNSAKILKGIDEPTTSTGIEEGVKVGDLYVCMDNGNMWYVSGIVRHHTGMILNVFWKELTLKGYVDDLVSTLVPGTRTIANLSLSSNITAGDLMTELVTQLFNPSINQSLQSAINYGSDSTMSDASSNVVKNKVIKAYVDDLVSTLAPKTRTIAGKSLESDWTANELGALITQVLSDGGSWYSTLVPWLYSLCGSKYQEDVNTNDIETLKQGLASKQNKLVYEDVKNLRWQIGAYSGSSGHAYTQNATNTAIRPTDGTFFEIKQGDKITIDDGYGMYLLRYERPDASDIPTVIGAVETYTFDSDCYLRMIAYKPGSPRPPVDYINIADIQNAVHLQRLVKPYNKPKELKGKKVSILGDSTSTFGGNYTTSGTDKFSDGVWTYENNRIEFPNASSGTNSRHWVTSVNDCWWKKIIDAQEMILGINDSWAGAMIQWDGETESTIAGENIHCASQTRIDHLGENGTPDVILVSCGSNDILHGSNIGTFDTTNPANLTNEEITNLPVNTFADATRTMFIRLQKTYPNARIVLVSPYYVTNVQLGAQKIDLYLDLMAEICDYFGVQFIDSRKCGLSIYNRDSYTCSDGLHLNQDGQIILAKAVNDCLLLDYSTNGIGRTTVGDLIKDKVDKEQGKGLSTNDYTTAEKQKLASLQNYDDSEIKQEILDTYSVKIITGSTVAIDDASNKPIKDLTVEIVPKQAGSGTPSPTNVRALSGWEAITLNVNSDEIEINLGRTVYGGSLDVTTGLLTVDRALTTYDGSESWQTYTGGNGYRLTEAQMKSGYDVGGLSDWLPTITSVSNFGIRFGSNNNTIYVTQIADNIAGVTDIDEWQSYLSNNPLNVVYPLATPQTYQLTPTQITLLLGNNTIYADCGNSTVEYRQDSTRALAKKVDDVQVNGTSITNDGVANIPIASANNLGVVRINANNGITISDGQLVINRSGTSLIKAGQNSARPITPSEQEYSTFYGMAKAAGDSTQSASANPVGTYTPEAKTKIMNMLGDKYELISTDTLTEASATFEKAINNYENVMVTFTAPSSFSAGTIATRFTLANQTTEYTSISGIALTNIKTITYSLERKASDIIKFTLSRNAGVTYDGINDVTSGAINKVKLVLSNTTLPSGTVIKIYGKGKV